MFSKRIGLLVLLFGAILSGESVKETPAASATIMLPEVVVNANKLPAESQSLPMSITPVTGDTIKDAGIKEVKDAAAYAPNVLMTDFGARKLSNPYFRGIGAGPSNPGITSYIDGVPQLNANSSSIELLQVDQLEFVRGPQGALYGANTIGGLININSKLPSKVLTLDEDAEFGNFNYKSEKLNLSGPLSGDNLLFSLGGGYNYNDGYSVNQVTGRGLDSRQTYFGKFQLLLKSNEVFNGRLIVSGERDNDGDYPLSELFGLRASPLLVSHDYEGYTKRDLLSNTLLMNYAAGDINIVSTTGYSWWKADESTDLDYTFMPLLTNRDSSQQYQFTQELRFSSAKPASLGNKLDLNWQSGLFFSSTDFSESSARNYSAFLPPAFTAFTDLSGAKKNNLGAGVYAQADIRTGDSVDIKGGARFDYQKASATLTTNPAFTAPAQLVLAREFNQVSPQVSISYDLAPGSMLYGTVARGYKSGGFNSLAPAGKEAYGEEYSWNYEAGAKTELMERKLELNLAFFLIDWEQLQLNVPDVTLPAGYYVSNAGSASSKGFELETRLRPAEGFDIFGSAGYTDARFGAGSLNLGSSVNGNTLPFTPQFKGNLGTQYSTLVTGGVSAFARAEATMFGNYKYDASNVQGQDNYILTDARAGLKGKGWLIEGWVKNIFNVNYVPVAFPYGALAAPSGYLGVSGAPRTFGARVGVTF